MPVRCVSLPPYATELVKLVQPRGKPCFSWQSPEISKNKSMAANGLHLLYKSVVMKIHSHSSGFGSHFSVLDCRKGRGLGNCGLGLVSLLQIPENFVKQCSDPDQMCQFIHCGGSRHSAGNSVKTDPHDTSVHLVVPPGCRNFGLGIRL